MSKKFEIFISYRRKGGYDTAKLFYDRLRLDGYSVFFDIDTVSTLRSGNFDKELEVRVKKCRDFILILSSGVFDRVSKKGYNEEDDWVRQEINHALKNNKNIVPLIQEGFKFPDDLPADVRDDICKKNSLELQPQHFEATYERMKESFLLSKPRWAVRNYKYIKNSIIGAVLAIAVYSFFMAYSFHQKQVEVIKAEAEQNEQNLTRTTDSIKAVMDSMKAVMDSIRITSEYERKLLIDSISRAVVDSINKVPPAIRAKAVTSAPVKTASAPAKTAPAKTAPAKTTQQKSSKTTPRSKK